MLTMFIAALFTTAKTWKQRKCPSTDKWKQDIVHTHRGILFSQKKKNEILPFATTWMDLEGIMFSEICETEKDKHCVMSLVCRI